MNLLFYQLWTVGFFYILCMERDVLNRMKNTGSVRLAEAVAQRSRTSAQQDSGKVEISWRWIEAVYSVHLIKLFCFNTKKKYY